MVKRKPLTEAEMTVAKEVVDKVDQIQERLEHLMALPPTEFAIGVQMHLRDARMMPLVEDLRKEVQEHLGSRAKQLREHKEDSPAREPVTSRLRSAMALRQRMMHRLQKRQGRETQGTRKGKSKDGQPKAKKVMPLLKKVLKAHKRGSRRPSPKKAASPSPPPPAVSSASSSTAPSSPCGASAAAASASGRAAARSRRSRATSPSAPTAPARPPPARSAASGPSAWASSGPTSSSTARSTRTRTSSPPS